MYARTLNAPRSKHRQAGMTTLGVIILVFFVGLFVFAGMRLAPVYLNYVKVIGVIDGVGEELDGTGASRSLIRQSIARRFDIESVGQLTAKEVEVKKAGEGYEVIAAYGHKTPFISNVSFVVDFDKRVTIRK